MQDIDGFISVFKSEMAKSASLKSENIATLKRTKEKIYKITDNFKSFSYFNKFKAILDNHYFCLRVGNEMIQQTEEELRIISDEENKKLCELIDYISPACEINPLEFTEYRQYKDIAEHYFKMLSNSLYLISSNTLKTIDDAYKLPVEVRNGELRFRNIETEFNNKIILLKDLYRRELNNIRGLSKDSRWGNGVTENFSTNHSVCKSMSDFRSKYSGCRSDFTFDCMIKSLNEINDHAVNNNKYKECKEIEINSMLKTSLTQIRLKTIPVLSKHNIHVTEEFIIGME